MDIYSLFIGRWQPFHKGHELLIQTALDRGKKVCVAIRDTKMSKQNPYTVKERKKFIKKIFPDIKIITIPDIDEVCYGRGVGYGIIKIKLDDETEKISGTKIRNNI